MRDFMKLKFKDTIIHSIATSSGTIINGLLGLLFYILLARNLSLEFFGMFALTVAFLTVCADIADVGVDTGLIRFIPKARSEKNQDFLKYLKLGFQIKMIIWVFVAILGWFMAPIISEVIFLKPQLTLALRISLIGVGGAMLFSFVTHSLQAFEKFISWSILNISLNALRLIILIILVTSVSLNLLNSLVVYMLLPFLGFFVGLLMLPKFFKVKNEWKLANEFLHYNKWIAFISIITAFSSRFDTFLSARFLRAEELGIYSAANQLTQVFPQLSFAVASVIAPKLSSLKDKKTAISYLKKTQLLVFLIALGAIILLPGAIFLIPLILGSIYTESIGPFVILFFAQLIFFLSIPVHQSIFYYFAKPKFFVFTNLLNLILMFILAIYLIPEYRVIGAALVILFGNIFNLLVPTVWVVYNFRKSK